MSNPHHEPRLGIDIGRVIIGPVDDDGIADTSFLSGSLDDAMRTPPTPGAFAAIARLTAAFDGRVWLVSKCGPRVQEKTRRWLDHWQFWTRTGIPPDHLRFCRERRDKALHCADLAITHFVDDRVDVLTHLVGLVPALYLFGKDWRDRAAPPWATPVFTWADAEATITRRSESSSEADRVPVRTTWRLYPDRPIDGEVAQSSRRPRRGRSRKAGAT